MQANLEPSEFAFLLQILSAEQAIGVNNAQLFPTDDTVREALLADGFEKLKEHGWLVAEGQKVNSNNQLMLMTTAVAAPEQVITLTRYSEDGNKQYIFYYISQDVIVEQFLTADHHYLLTKLDSPETIALRASLALQIPTTIESPYDSVTLDSNTFTQAMKLARTGNLAPLITALQQAGIPSGADKQLAKIFSQLQPQADIEISQLSGHQLMAQRSMLILQEIDKIAWSMMEDPALGLITMQVLDKTALSQLLQSATVTNG